jgi:hypothetical protein
VASSVVFGYAQRERSRNQLTPSVHHGSAGVKRTQSGADVRWRTRRTEVVIDSSVERLGPNAVAAVQNAFGTWLASDPKLPALSFNSSRGAKVEAKPDGKNSVLVAPIRIPGHEHDLAVTLTYSDEDTGAIVEADIVINSAHAFRVFNDDKGRAEPGDDVQASTMTERRSCMAGEGTAKSCGDGAYDVQNIMTHEVGHFFGLGEDMTDNGASMFYCTSRCETHKRALTDADTGSISALYESAAADETTEASAASCGARLSPKGNLGEAAIALSAVLFLVSRRRRTPA